MALSQDFLAFIRLVGRMHRKIEVTAELIEKFHLGLATPEEADAIANWLNEGTIEVTPLALSPQQRTQKKSSLWAGIQQKSNAQKPKPETTRHPRSFTTTAIAAGICLVIAIFLYNISPDNKPGAKVQYKELQSNNGQKSNITLSDGTVIHLNAGSTLSYPDQFRSGERVVRLSGEAYFEVAEDKHKPFIIQTKQGIVRVLGTKFNLKAFQNDLTESLSLDEGSVKYLDVVDSSNFVLISPKQHAILNDTDNSFTLRPAKAQDVAWRQNRLAFADLPLSEIAKQLERWYGVSINLRQQKIASQRYTGTYHNPTLNSLLQQLSYVMGFKYTILKEKEVLIY